MNPRALSAALFTIAVWASLALLTDRVSHLPPMLASGLALMVGGLVGAWQPGAWRAPWATYLLGVGGLLGYHALLFAAFRLAPAVEANLLQYLWPLLIVLLTPLFLPGRRLSIAHIAGALLGFGGAALIVGGGQMTLSGTHAWGYACAIAAAAVWAIYSLGCRRLPPFPTSAIAACCLLAGALAVLAQVALDGPQALQRLNPSDGLLLLVLGLGPMGVAFLTWDIAMKHGDPRAIGALSYLTPLLSTLLLTGVNGHDVTAHSALAMVAILAGALLGNMEALRAVRGALPTGEGPAA